MALTVAHLHLLINHVPILGSIFITILYIVALIYRNAFLQKVSLWFLVAVALCTPITYLSGDKAIPGVQGLPGVSEQMIHMHEYAAKFGLLLMFITGILALGSAIFYRKQPKLPRLLLTVILVVLLINSAVFAYIGLLGGQIHHEEIRTTQSSPVSLLKQS